MQEVTTIKNYLVFRDGEAVIAGHANLKAEYVARRHVDGGDSIDEVMEHYGLTRPEVYAALAYYYENQVVLDARNDTFWAEAQASGHTASQLRAEIEVRRRDQQL